MQYIFERLNAMWHKRLRVTMVAIVTIILALGVDLCIGWYGARWLWIKCGVTYSWEWSRDGQWLMRVVTTPAAERRFLFAHHDEHERYARPEWILDRPAPYWSSKYRDIEEARGWPFRSLLCYWEYDEKRDVVRMIGALGADEAYQVPVAAPYTSKPYLPLWRGLALNAVVIGTMMTLLWLPPTLVFLSWRQANRYRKGCCVYCNHDLRHAHKGSVCPECGMERN